jgi:hypothetical protein
VIEPPPTTPQATLYGVSRPIRANIPNAKAKSFKAKAKSVNYGVSTEVLPPFSRLYAALGYGFGDQDPSDKPLPCASGTRSVYLMHLDTVNNVCDS